MSTKVKLFSATGRRKTAAARAIIRPGSGKVVINGLTFKEYLPVETMRIIVEQPLKLTATLDKLDITISTSGGGKAGQAGAIRHAIARALVKYDANLKAAIKKAGYLTRDQRMKERKKYGQPGARKRFQFSKR